MRAGCAASQRIARAIVGRHGDKLLVGGESAGLGGDVGTKVADHVAAFVHIAAIPAQTFRIDKMRAWASDCEQGAW
jgi:hypothetical protein